MKKKILPIFIAILAVCACLSFALASASKKGDVTPTVAVVEIQPTETPAATEAPAIPAAIPGILPADVIINLENKGLECGEVTQPVDYYIRTCKRETSNGMLFVEVYGRELLSVDFISATVTQFTVDKSLPAEFFGYVSTIPFVDDASLQDQAKTWASETAPLLAGETTINGVRFEISGVETAVTLEIGLLK